MIEKMKNVFIVARASHKDEMLTALRKMGILHLAEKKDADPAITERLGSISRLSLELKDYAPEKGESRILSDEEFEEMYRETVNALSKKSELEDARNAALAEADKLRVWGDFDPQLARDLKDGGMELHFYRMGEKEFAQLAADENIRFIRLAPVEKMETVAVLGDQQLPVAANEFIIPEKGVSALEKEADECSKGIEECVGVLRKSAAYLDSYSDQLLKTQNRSEYSSVSRTAEDQDGLVWLTGYIPETDEASFIQTAKEKGWAWYIQDISEEDETVPTKIKYNKVTALIRPVFDILGTVPGYREYDISFWFLAFFALFFAMIIGDAGYGLLFLIGAAVLAAKSKKVTNITLLLFILSGATVVWGAVTGTWFGLEGAMKIPILKALVLPGFANYPEYFNQETTVVQNNVMKFCFSIGAIQLALACIMNIRRKLNAKDLSWISDLGWLCSVCALYFVVLYLVIGQEINFTAAACVVGCGFLLVVLFGGMAPGKSFSQGLKSGLGDAFTVFLNTISAFGNIMSYIRLFAVGMASLAIAQSFNNMAAGFGGPLIVVGAVIMIIGHVMNIVMGFLSVVVHGVRLNLLEFSGQLGMEWSGTAYDPFRELDQIKK